METWAGQIAGTIALLCLLTGCAYSYVGADGSRHVVGLVHVSIPPAGPQPARASSLRARALGLAFTHGDVGSALSLGYSDITLAYVRADTCVRWPIGTASPASTERKSP